MTTWKTVSGIWASTAYFEMHERSAILVLSFSLHSINSKWVFFRKISAEDNELIVADQLNERLAYQSPRSTNTWFDYIAAIYNTVRRATQKGGHFSSLVRLLVPSVLKTFCCGCSRISAEQISHSLVLEFYASLDLQMVLLINNLTEINSRSEVLKDSNFIFVDWIQENP